jgi:proline-specific peptidase
MQGAERRVAVPGGSVWVRAAGGGAGTPLLLVHGGPGIQSRYLEGLEALGDERVVVRYDQLGCGRSDRPEDPALWHLERFVEELAAVRAALGLHRVVLHGHSWGATVALEAVLGGAPGVAGLVLASPLVSTPRWAADADRLRRRLPLEVQEVLARHEAAGTTGSPEYEEAALAFYRRFVCRRDPWPAVLAESLADLARAPYLALWGPSEFHPTGRLRHHDRTARLGEIRVPTLLTGGRHDEATPETLAEFRDRVPGAGLAILEDSAHMTMLEEPEAYQALLRAFLRRVDAPGAGPQWESIGAMR